MKLKLLKPYQWRPIYHGFVVTLLLVNFPSSATAFTIRSSRSIELTDFDPLPQGVAVVADGQAITIADEGIVETMIVENANFMVDNQSALARANSDISISGVGRDFLADIRFFSTLVGRFSVAAGDSLNFNLNGSLSLQNSIDETSIGSASASDQTAIFLRDLTNQRRIDVLEVFGVLNTTSTSIKRLNRDLFAFNLSRDVRLNRPLDRSSFQDTTESLQTFFSGSFQRQFNEDTELALIIENQSCNFASNDADVCVSVPEPRNNLAILIGFLGSLGFNGVRIVLTKIMKRKETKK